MVSVDNDVFKIDMQDLIITIVMHSMYLDVQFGNHASHATHDMITFCKL